MGNAPSGSAGTSGGDSGAGGSSTGVGGGAVSANPNLPARIRRLTNAEYDASVQALLGTTMAPSSKFSFPPDARQGPTNAPAGPAFTVNDAQRVDPVLADKLDTAAQALVTEARGNGKLAGLSPCASATGSGGEACAKSFLQTFGAKAYRRPMTDDEVTSLVSGSTSAYHVGADGYTYNDGIDLLTRILLQSPGFLYLTELGDGGGAMVTMTPNEIASALSYLLTSGPPDDTLRGNAASGMLATPEGREAEARRLLATPAGHARFVRVVREWLGIDDVAHREKAQTVYPDFSGAAQAIENESRAFIEEVLYNSTGTLAELLTADWTIAEAPVAAVYGVSSAGTGKRTSLTGVKRRGILDQAAFLSVFAVTNGSHPVFRGVAIMRRIACLAVPDPSSQGLAVSFPAADPSKTTRARFEVHETSEQCAGCHKIIDPFGFAFESFDGMGKMRTTDNNQAVDTRVTIDAGSDLDGTYADSTELASALAQSTEVKTCLARHLFHSTAARSDSSIAGAEKAFLQTWQQLPADQQGRLADVLVAFVRSTQFVQRRTP